MSDGAMRLSSRAAIRIQKQRHIRWVSINRVILPQHKNLSATLRR